MAVQLREMAEEDTASAERSVGGEGGTNGRRGVNEKGEVLKGEGTYIEQ